MTVLCCVCEHGVGCLNALKCIGPYPQRALTLVLAREIFSILFIYFVRLIYSYAKQKILKCTFTSKQSFVWLPLITVWVFSAARVCKAVCWIPCNTFTSSSLWLLFSSSFCFFYLLFLSYSLSRRPWRTSPPSAWPSITLINPPDCWMFLPEAGKVRAVGVVCVLHRCLKAGSWNKVYQEIPLSLSLSL